MTERPEPIKHQIHTVLLTRDKRQGVALGLDGETGRAIKIWLMTPRAVERGLEQLRTVARACGRRRGKPTSKKLDPERIRRLSSSRAREWSLR